MEEGVDEVRVCDGVRAREERVEEESDVVLPTLSHFADLLPAEVEAAALAQAGREKKIRQK